MNTWYVILRIITPLNSMIKLRGIVPLSSFTAQWEKETPSSQRKWEIMREDTAVFQPLLVVRALFRRVQSVIFCPTVVPAAYTAMYSRSGAIGPRSVVNDVVLFQARRAHNNGYDAHAKLKLRM